MKSESPDWMKLAEPDPSVAGDLRSCANCLHKRDKGWPDSPIFWYCVRTMRDCWEEVRFSSGSCGSSLRLWTAMPPKTPGGFWARILRRTR
jgi:hypothetical protein